MVLYIAYLGNHEFVGGPELTAVFNSKKQSPFILRSSLGSWKSFGIITVSKTSSPNISKT